MKEDASSSKSRTKRRGEKAREAPEQKTAPQKKSARKVLTVEDGTDAPLTGVAIFLLRTSTKRTLG